MRQKGCEDVFNVSQLSDGTLRFICLAVLLLQPKELQPATIIIDEPELGLHPYAITMLAEIIHQVSTEKQIIISTQSVELLNEFDPEDVIVVDRGEDGSEFKRRSRAPLSGAGKGTEATGGSPREPHSVRGTISRELSSGTR